MKYLLIIGCFVCVSPALAQSQMPNPRQMSGIPRAQPGDPAGQLIVRVLQGSVADNARIGTYVHLTGVAVDGTLSYQKQPVDDGGRATFVNLKTDGSIAYYVNSILTRQKIQDRLASRVIMMPPHTGVRVMLAGLSITDTQVGIDEARLSLSDKIEQPNQVTLSIGGQYGKSESATLINLVTSEEQTQIVPDPEPSLGQLPPRKTGVFRQIASGNNHIYIAAVSDGQQRYFSPPFQLTRDAGIHSSVFVWATPLLLFRLIAEFEDDKVWFQMRYTLQNTTGKPYRDQNRKGILIPFPSNAISPGVADEYAQLVGVLDNEGFLWRKSLAPGSNVFLGSLGLSSHEGALSTQFPMPFGAIEGTFFIQEWPGMTVVTKPSISPRTHETSIKTKFSMYDQISLIPGESFEISMSGLPLAAPWIYWSKLFAGLSAIVIVLIGIRLLFRPRES